MDGTKANDSRNKKCRSGSCEIGITEKKLNELLTNKLESKNGSSFGILNINERIKLLYGNEYWVIVRSEYGTSTTVEIRIPTSIT
ncbi:hypothetical protein GCM10008018_43060 [Paenibacillus marchantiophytorum]|uniref:Sensor histidine kinase n=1 Tax=Paenibacillus marchantiophytorum TaxID=1619310 RepID=A0ABQ1EXN0_9BACL|nr:hypothetical protein GCM10008018_43060 [Paenibacillus marchantiophytorum]